jgi:hypothetical protein
MHTYAQFAGVFLIAVGILYLRKPNLFRRGIWVKTGIAERNLSPEKYIKYHAGRWSFQHLAWHCTFSLGVHRALRMKAVDFDKLNDAEKQRMISRTMERTLMENAHILVFARTSLFLLSVLRRPEGAAELAYAKGSTR